MDEAADAGGGAESPAQPEPYTCDSAHWLFMQHIDMSLYEGVDNGARRQNSIYPNPPIQMPARDDEQMTDYLRKRVSDIESGRVKMKSYTFDEYMLYLDKIWGSQDSCGSSTRAKSPAKRPARLASSGNADTGLK